jgi:hypothetical protein
MLHHRIVAIAFAVSRRILLQGFIVIDALPGSPALRRELAPCGVRSIIAVTDGSRSAPEALAALVAPYLGKRLVRIARPDGGRL